MDNVYQRILCAAAAILFACLCSAVLAEEAVPTPMATVLPTPLPTMEPGEEARYTTVWKITAPEISTEVLLAEAFGTDSPEARCEERKYSSFFWQLYEDGLPFCGVGHRLGTEEIQTEFDIYRYEDAGEERVYFYDLDEYNILPAESGFGAPRAAETGLQAAELAGRLGLVTGSITAVPVSFNTLGNMEGTTPCRKVILEERLEGLPVRWSETALRNDDMDSPAMLVRPCYVEAVYSDEDGLLKLEGSWCAFEPLHHASGILSPEEALRFFRKAGLAEDEAAASVPEACWFLSADENGATATLSYRLGNNYLNAEDGSWLQAGK